MGYLASAAPDPVPSIEDAVFWDHCARHDLRCQKCTGCGTLRFPPAPACHRCAAMTATWEKLPERAELFSFTVVHHPASEAFAKSVPYNVAIVAFPEAGGIRMVSNVVDADELRIGMPLTLVWETAGNGQPLPRFSAAV